MVDHRSTSLPEYRPTEYLASEPCYWWWYLMLSVEVIEDFIEDFMHHGIPAHFNGNYFGVQLAMW